MENKAAEPNLEKELFELMKKHHHQFEIKK
jgi:hypothetical protein